MVEQFKALWKAAPVFRWSTTVFVVGMLVIVMSSSPAQSPPPSQQPQPSAQRGPPAPTALQQPAPRTGLMRLLFGP